MCHSRWPNFACGKFFQKFYGGGKIFAEYRAGGKTFSTTFPRPVPQVENFFGGRTKENMPKNSKGVEKMVVDSGPNGGGG